MNYMYELIGWKDGKSVSFERVPRIEDVRNLLSIWKKDGSVDKIFVDEVTNDSRILLHSRTIHSLKDGKWKKRRVLYLEDDKV